MDNALEVAVSRSVPSANWAAVLRLLVHLDRWRTDESRTGNQAASTRGTREVAHRGHNLSTSLGAAVALERESTTKIPTGIFPETGSLMSSILSGAKSYNEYNDDFFELGFKL